MLNRRWTWVVLVGAVAFALIWSSRSDGPREALSRASSEPVMRATLGIAPEAHAIITLTNVEVRMEGRTRAIANFRVTVSDSQARDLHARPRGGRAVLTEQSGYWRVDSVVIEPEGHGEPEPRP